MAEQLKRRRQRGFSLIELMVAVAIAGVLAALAYPSYRDSILKSKRTSAKARMAEVASREEQFYSEQTTSASYTTELMKLAYASETLQSEAKGHAITVVAGSDGIASSFKVQATPVPADADPKCGVLTLTSQGSWLPAGC